MTIAVDMGRKATKQKKKSDVVLKNNLSHVQVFKPEWRFSI